MRFEWDENKADQVEMEHGIEFARILDVFEDANAIEFIDELHSTESETRFAIIGLTGEYGLIFLVFTDVDPETVRFITARRAENWMVDEYEENRSDK